MSQLKVSSYNPSRHFGSDCGDFFFFLQPDSKKEEFRRYLESAGVLDAFTKGTLLILLGLKTIRDCVRSSSYTVLVGLYEEPEKPHDALEYPSSPTHLVYIQLSA